MAITADTTSTGVVVGNTVLTWSHTCSGSDRVLVVTMNDATGLTVSSITYNTVALSLGKSQVNGTNSANIYYLKNPASGAHDIVITVGASGTFRGRAASFNGVEQTAPLGATNGESGTAQNKDITITTTQAGSVLIDAIGANGGTDTPAAGQTLFQTTGGGNTRSAYEIVAGITEYTQSWTGDTADTPYAMAVIELKASVVVANTTNFFHFIN
jgi:hypothetical protein